MPWADGVAPPATDLMAWPDGRLAPSPAEQWTMEVGTQIGSAEQASLGFQIGRGSVTLKVYLLTGDLGRGDSSPPQGRLDYTGCLAEAFRFWVLLQQQHGRQPSAAARLAELVRAMRGGVVCQHQRRAARISSAQRRRRVRSPRQEAASTPNCAPTGRGSSPWRLIRLRLADANADEGSPSVSGSISA